MRKLSSITTNQKGFILPYVLFMIALFLIAVTSSVQLYQSEIHVTQNQTDQLKIETLFQMAHTQFKEHILKVPETTNEMTYVYPYGEVLIEYAELKELEYQVNFIIKTHTGATHNINKRLNMNRE